MLFTNTVIIGLGLLGGSLARALRKYGVSRKITGISRSDTYSRAKELGIIDAGFPLDDSEQGVKNADLVILAVPVRKICALIPEVIPQVREGCTITDVGSTKHIIIEVANTFEREGVYFVGGHPMAGSEKRRLDAGSADLFQNKPYALVRSQNTPDDIFGKMSDMVTKIGGYPLAIDGVMHDRIVAGTSHLPQILMTTLVNFLGRANDENERYFSMSGPALKEITRIAESDFSVWEDILVSNQRNISAVLMHFIEELTRVHKKFHKPAMQEDFASAQFYRKQLVNNRKVQ